MTVPTTKPREAITGLQAHLGHGAPPPKGFWADAWSRVLKRPGAVLGLAWISIVAFFAVFAPLIANGHPLVLRELDGGGNVVRTTSPLVENLKAVDILLLAGAVLGAVWMLAPIGVKRGERLLILLAAVAQAGATVLLAQAVAGYAGRRDAADWVRRLEQAEWFVPAASAIAAGLIGAVFLAVPTRKQMIERALIVGLVAVGAGVTISQRWSPPLQSYTYLDREIRGEVRATYTLVPWSPTQGSTSLYVKRPGSTLSEALGREIPADAGRRRFLLGTDALGQDVLSHLLHACRLAVSIGLVSTGIAVTIGVTIGALMGYFGGKVDLLLYRVVEVFMAIPVLFLLIVAVAVLPRSTYVMMAVIGCVTWTGAARFTRAEFLRLREQDFVQSARAVGLPLRSILFRHMLPNGVTPVLVDASFAIAAAILAEATLSYLGLGPEGQASWGKLLSSATGVVGDFVWWLAIFPGMAIFLTVLSYNLIGEALRDAIDPKLRKARV